MDEKAFEKVLDMSLSDLDVYETKVVLYFSNGYSMTIYGTDMVNIVIDEYETD